MRKLQQAYLQTWTKLLYATYNYDTDELMKWRGKQEHLAFTIRSSSSLNSNHWHHHEPLYQTVCWESLAKIWNFRNTQCLWVMSVRVYHEKRLFHQCSLGHIVVFISNLWHCHPNILITASPSSQASHSPVRDCRRCKKIVHRNREESL